MKPKLYTAIFYEEKTNEITWFMVRYDAVREFKLGANVTITSFEPKRIATMIGIL